METKLAERLRILRHEYSETQQEVADALHIKRATYTMYERGGILPPYDKLKTLAEHFHVSVDYLMGESNFRKPKKDKGTPPLDLMDVNNVVRHLLDELNDNSAPLHADGVLLDKSGRDMLKTALNTCLNIGELLTNSTIKEESPHA